MKYWLHIGLLLVVTGCNSAPPKLLLDRVEFSDLKGWRSGNHTLALSALKKSCSSMIKRQNSFKMKPHAGSISQWKPACRKALRTTTNARRFFEQNFTPFTANNWHNSQGLFTGYHVPELRGSLTKTAKFKYPVYRKLKTGGTPKNSRYAIDNGALNGKNLELLYVDNAIELFFMHIQGSGNVRMPNGSITRLGYAGQNGHRYVSIGGYLISRDIMTREEVTAPSLKAWLHNNPRQATQVMHQNPSYIFFRKLKGTSTSGPIGAQGVELTANHSLAVDNKFISYGTPIWLETTLPATKSTNAITFNQLLIAQDTGGAIKGPVRGDIFFGSTPKAAQLAGNMNMSGRYHILLPNKVVTMSQP